MSNASMAASASMRERISSVHGSAPKTPTLSGSFFMSTPCCWAASMRWRK